MASFNSRGDRMTEILNHKVALGVKRVTVYTYRE